MLLLLSSTRNMSNQDEEGIPDINLFMMCERLSSNALSELSTDYYVRNCRKDELDIWKEMPFDDPKESRRSSDFEPSVLGTGLPQRIS